MNPGFVRCPLCKRTVVLLRRTGQMNNHWVPSKAGAGFHGLSQKCPGSYKKPEALK